MIAMCLRCGRDSVRVRKTDDGANSERLPYLWGNDGSFILNRTLHTVQAPYAGRQGSSNDCACPNNVILIRPIKACWGKSTPSLGRINMMPRRPANVRVAFHGTSSVRRDLLAENRGARRGRGTGVTEEENEAGVEWTEGNLIVGGCELASILTGLAVSASVGAGVM